VHTVCETLSFRRAAKQAGLTEAEADRLIVYLSQNPMAGDVMPGTGGCRKLRFAKQGEGKRGSYRIITFYSGDRIPVFLITVFSKGERSDLDKNEQNALAGLTKRLVETYQKGVRDEKGKHHD
jgi:hypothetical protein